MTETNVHCNHAFLSISLYCGSGNNCCSSCRVILTIFHLIPGLVSESQSESSSQNLNPVTLWHLKTVPEIPNALVQRRSTLKQPAELILFSSGFPLALSQSILSCQLRHYPCPASSCRIYYPSPLTLLSYSASSCQDIFI